MEDRGQELPDWYLDRPELEQGDELYLEAFHRLSTCRPYTFGGPGPIPWTATVAYAEFLGLDRDLWPVLDTVIRAADTVWLQWHTDNAPQGGKG